MGDAASEPSSVPSVLPAGPLVIADLFKMIDDPSVRWESLRPGVRIHRLFRWPTGQSAALLRYEPGASLPRHIHVAPEYILVLRGSQADENGLHRRGALLVHPGATSHTIRTETGCVVLAIWEQPVVFDPQPHAAARGHPTKE
jgi:anti-sigma factor ChrR (cupin superfamily)